MTLSADERLPENYTNNYWKADDSFPKPTGLFGKYIEKEKNLATQKEEAEQLLEYIEQKPRSYDDLAATGKPFPMLIKVPHSHNVRMISGLAPLLQDPFASVQDPMNGQLFAIMHDVDKTNQNPSVIRLPDSALRVEQIMIPTDDQWFDKIIKKDDASNGKVWFQQAAVKDNTEELAMVCPIVPFWAYDAFTEDVPAHVVWERIHSAEEEDCDNVRDYAKDWLKGVHVAHNATNNNKIEIDSEYFFERATAVASEWGKKKVQTIYPSVTAADITTAPASGGGSNAALAILAQALAAAQGGNPQTVVPIPGAPVVQPSPNYLKYGMSDEDVDRMCILCGLQKGQGAGLPAWFEKVNNKYTGKDGKKTLLRKLLKENLKYEEHPVPVGPSALEMILNKAFTGDGDNQTPAGVMKGMSPFLFATQSAEEIAEANSYAEALNTSTSTTVAELQKLRKKAKAPQNMTDLINLLKTFANVLDKLFTAGCPLLIRLKKDAIVPLVKLNPVAKTVFSKETIAAIAWAVYHQAMFFAQGDMTGKNPLTSEWVQMTNAVKGGGRSLENYSIPLAMSNRFPITPTKQTEDDDNDDEGGSGDGTGRKTGKGTRKTRKNRKKDSEKGVDTETRLKKSVKVTMDIHPKIQAKVTAVLPEFLKMKEICQICDTNQRFLFGDNICAFAAIKGFCPFTHCNASHDSSKVTDEMAERVIEKLDPVLRNPGQLSEG